MITAILNSECSNKANSIIKICCSLSEKTVLIVYIIPDADLSLSDLYLKLIF